jgi:hypothetical protein
MHEPEQGTWPIDPEALRARTQPASFPTMVFGLSSMVLVTQYVGPAEQHPNALLVSLSAALCLVPYTLLALSKNVEYLLSPRGAWLRIVDYLTWPLCVFLVACTTHTSMPASLIFPIAWAVVWPTWHPRNLAAASLLVWGMPLLRWLLMPDASLASLAVLAAGGVAALLLYLSSARRLDRFRALRAVVKQRQHALESATTAQRLARLAMSVHDGLSGLAAVAEAGVESAPHAQATASVLELLQQRLAAMVGASEATSINDRMAALHATARTAGIELKFDAARMRAWDEIAAEDLLEIITELVTNHMRHSAPAPLPTPHNKCSIHIGREAAEVDLESQLPARPHTWLPRRTLHYGLRNVASRIDAHGGSLRIDAGSATFRVVARIPNRRLAFAPPLLRTAIPSFILVFAVGLALALGAHWYFIWVHLAWYVVIFIAHFKQIELLCLRMRQVSERIEAEFVNLHIEEQRELVRARLLPFQAGLQAQGSAELAQVIGDLRRELGALLFALEWQGTGSELALQLGLSSDEAASIAALEAVPRTRMIELVLQARMQANAL